MEVNLQTELENLENAKNAINEKLTSIFQGKWVIVTRPDGFRFNRESRFLKNKNGNYIVFKIESCRPKACSINSIKINEIVLAGVDSRGQMRTETCKRDESVLPTENEMLASYIFDIPLFESEEEAVLYATLQEQLNPKKDLF